MSFWTHAAMRGQSAWTVGERELMAAMTAKWNACPFCIGAHGAIAARVLGKLVVETALDDFQQAELPAKLRATLTFLEILTRRPDKLTAEDARAVLRGGSHPRLWRTRLRSPSSSTSLAVVRMPWITSF